MQYSWCGGTGCNWSALFYFSVPPVFSICFIFFFVLSGVSEEIAFFSANDRHCVSPIFDNHPESRARRNGVPSVQLDFNVFLLVSLWSISMVKKNVTVSLCDASIVLFYHWLCFDDIFSL